ncbi:MAG: hypothetical protein M3220_22805 [Chloroflexota bacterium]|nr:hypothetical protein [Chloroflexota bacterium]
MRVLLIVILLAALLLASYRFMRPATPASASASLVDVIGTAQDGEGFTRATDRTGLTFPDAYGPHPDYQTEWWYYTGNVQTADGRPFGYELTFFRRALVPGTPERTSEFATHHLYMSHFAITDASGEEFYYDQRFERAGSDLAGAQAEPFQVWLDEWSVEEVEPGLFRLEAEADEMAVDFTLRALKPPAQHGDNGLSAKGDEPGNATYYYSLTRLDTVGTITLRGQSFEVSGLSWKDHEFGTWYLPEGAVGWDWFSLQLSDGRDLMYGRIRSEDHGTERPYGRSLVLQDGTVRTLDSEDVEVDILDTWTSPHTRAIYPARWRLRIPSEALELTIEPLIADQELLVSTIYWEGAVRAEGSAEGKPLSARGYVELTGYAGEALP